MKSIMKTMSCMLVMAALLMTAFPSCSNDHEEQEPSSGGLEPRIRPTVAPKNKKFTIKRDGTQISKTCSGYAMTIEANEVSFEGFSFIGDEKDEEFQFWNPCKLTLKYSNSIVSCHTAEVLVYDTLYLSGRGSLTFSVQNEFTLKQIVKKVVAAEGYQIMVSEFTTDEENTYFENGTAYNNTKCKIEVK